MARQRCRRLMVESAGVGRGELRDDRWEGGGGARALVMGYLLRHVGFSTHFRAAATMRSD